MDNKYIKYKQKYLTLKTEYDIKKLAEERLAPSGYIIHPELDNIIKSQYKKYGKENIIKNEKLIDKKLEELENIQKYDGNLNKNKSINVNKELEFFLGIRLLKYKFEKEFSKWYWSPHEYINGLPKIENPKNEFEKTVIKIHKYLKKPRKFKERYINAFYNNIDRIIIKHGFKFDKNIDYDLQRFAIHRYNVVGALNNISLSVSPNIKKKWNINFELFGSFYNTHYDYCGLFNDIENNKCDFNTFKLKDNMTLLINPPYTESWIQKSCEIIKEFMESKKNITIYLVIPIWNNSDRLKEKLEIKSDMKIIDNIKKIKYLKKHSLENLDFYNGIIKEQVYLKDKVHVFIFKN